MIYIWYIYIRIYLYTTCVGKCTLHYPTETKLSIHTKCKRDIPVLEGWSSYWPILNEKQRVNGCELAMRWHWSCYKEPNWSSKWIFGQWYFGIFWVDIHGRRPLESLELDLHHLWPIKKTSICVVDSEQGQGLDSYWEFMGIWSVHPVFFGVWIHAVWIWTRSTCCQEHATMNPRLKMQRNRWV